MGPALLHLAKSFLSGSETPPYCQLPLCSSRAGFVQLSANPCGLGRRLDPRHPCALTPKHVFLSQLEPSQTSIKMYHFPLHFCLYLTCSMWKIQEMQEKQKMKMKGTGPSRQASSAIQTV